MLIDRLTPLGTSESICHFNLLYQHPQCVVFTTHNKIAFMSWQICNLKVENSVDWYHVVRISDIWFPLASRLCKSQQLLMRYHLLSMNPKYLKGKCTLMEWYQLPPILYVQLQKCWDSFVLCFWSFVNSLNNLSSLNNNASLLQCVKKGHHRHFKTSGILQCLI